MISLRVPPGRAGRLWLRRRLDTAEHGAALLDRKLRALREQQRRLAIQVHYTGEEWTGRARQAHTWLLRAVLAGGQRGLRLAGDGQSAAVAVTWTSAMGVRFPAEATCVLPADSPSSPSLPGSTAVVAAQRAHRAALQAAVRHAAALAAERAVSAEVAVTRQRARALRRHWIPRLSEALARVELELAEQERAEGVRHRWAADQEST
jgi:V/A-type H+-transporting ATPase subunit D